MRPRFSACAALVAVLSFLPTIACAAEAADESPDNGPVIRKIKDAGTRLAAAEIAPASDEGELALKRMKLPPGLVAKLWAKQLI